MVRVAAADALKAVDSKTSRLALELMEKNGDVRGALSDTILKLGEDGEPLAPLVAYYALQSGGLQEADLQRRIAEKLRRKEEIHSLTSSNETLGPQLIVLARIAGKDLAACKLIASALSNPDPGVRRVAIDLLAEMKHGALAISRIISLLKSDHDDNRLAAIKTLVALADKSTEEIITAAVTDQRLDKNGKIRDAVDDALNKLQNK
jgi:HEAT repeat protein